MQTNKKAAGFTLIELLVVIGIIAILAAIVIVAINPAKRFQDSRNSQRAANVESILSAIQQNMVDNKGITTCTIPAAATDIKNSGGTDLSGCLSQYLAVLPTDPKTGHWNSSTDYDSRYSVMVNASNQVTVASLDSAADGGGTISVTR